MQVRRIRRTPPDRYAQAPRGNKYTPGPHLYGHTSCVVIPTYILKNHKFSIYSYPNIEPGKANSLIKEKAQELLLRYFRIKRTTDENTRETTLDIYTMSGEDAVVHNGEILTTSDLVDLITESTENGTFLVDENPIRIHGLGTAAYTPIENYTPMEVSI